MVGTILYFCEFPVAVAAVVTDCCQYAVQDLRPEKGCVATQNHKLPLQPSLSSVKYNTHDDIAIMRLFSSTIYGLPVSIVVPKQLRESDICVVLDERTIVRVGVGMEVSVNRE